jgi:Ca2+-dependent lipid-binding protein
MKLKVDIVKAKDLKDADVLSKSDPYCRLKCNLCKDLPYCSEFVKNNLNPEWNETAELELEGDVSEGTLEAWVLDKDRFSDEDLGSVNIKLSDIQANKGMEDWFDLTLKDGTKKGQLYLKLTLV